MKINIRRWNEIDRSEQERLLARSEQDVAAVEDVVRRIIDAVRTEGDAAIRRFTAEFDGLDMPELPLRVSPEELAGAREKLEPEVRDAIAIAIDNVTRFHQLQKPEGMHLVEQTQGLLVGERATPVSSAGLYAPRGRGSFPSMLYMLAIPARIAGVPRICVATPPNPDGAVDPACLYAAGLCGVDEVYRIGGAQAVAAMALGSESVPKVSKIVSPGSAHVTAAKRLLYGHTDVGLPAGPTESIILADEGADAWRVSLDLLIEAEHGSDSSALLITASRRLADAVAQTLPGLVEALPEPRRTFASDVLGGYGGIIVTESEEQAIAVVNDFAPEHLQIRTVNPLHTAGRIENAGELLLGEHSPFSLANYAAGPNAVLPTGGKAKTYSPVSVRDFMKYSSIVYAQKEGLESLRETIIALAKYEGFPSHAAALERRDER